MTLLFVTPHTSRKPRVSPLAAPARLPARPSSASPTEGAPRRPPSPPPLPPSQQRALGPRVAGPVPPQPCALVSALARGSAPRAHGHGEADAKVDAVGFRLPSLRAGGQQRECQSDGVVVVAPAAAQRSAGEKPANAVVKVAREADGASCFRSCLAGTVLAMMSGKGSPLLLQKGAGDTAGKEKISLYFIFAPKEGKIARPMRNCDPIALPRPCRGSSVG